MAAKKILTVFGATGAQGGGVITTFLGNAQLKNDWVLRGVTRDVSKDSAKKLSAQGVEVVAVSRISPLLSSLVHVHPQRAISPFPTVYEC